MSIKPIDYNVILPKTQEISATKHVENVKQRNAIESGFIEQNKMVNVKQTKISDSEKTNKTGIRDDNNSRNRSESNSKRKKKQKEEGRKRNNILLGDKIDIHI